jgi:RNA polymerase sigma factor (sigma-70 family)
MPTNSMRRALDRLRQALAVNEVSDEQLLQQFIAGRDESAFAGIVRRHGAMVLGVGRRVLGNLHDSEDVFQATFLVLAQKARSVVHRDALASWLYRVAYRIALKARAGNDRRRRQEKQVDLMSHPHSQPPLVEDWEVLLDQELSRLPEKYRVPVILCDLEGRTRKEVERRLHLAPGTLSSRLTTARRMLADRLARQGIAMSAGALAMAVSQATAAVPAGLARATAAKAMLVAAGQFAGISSSVTILMKTGAKAMFLAKLKTTVATVMILGVLGASGLVYSGGGQAKPQSEPDALRKENELLKVNLRVTLEKIQALERELAAFKSRKADSTAAARNYYEEVARDYYQSVGKNHYLTGAAKKPPVPAKTNLNSNKRSALQDDLVMRLASWRAFSAEEGRLQAIEALNRILEMLHKQAPRRPANVVPVEPAPK